MNPSRDSSRYRLAMEDFRRARRHAATSQILRRLRGQPVDLLPFDEIIRRTEGESKASLGLQRIPIHAIVGSVGRYKAFTRDFLPRSPSLQERWAHIKSTFPSVDDMPPIQVYKVGKVYFVLDGNHRVSIARERGARFIKAYVTEIQTDVEVRPDTNLDNLILEIERTHFRKRTKLQELSPSPNLTITAPGRYPIIESQIETLLEKENAKGDGEITFQAAAQQWYQEIYQPIVKIIRRHDMLRDFPDRTETDLYVWISQHRDELQKDLGWEIDPEDAATHLTDQFSSRPGRIAARLKERLFESLIPPSVESGPEPGEWRRRHRNVERREHLFKRILVPLSGEPQSWHALREAILFAKLDKSQLLGLHIVSQESQKNSPKVENIRAKFNRICQEAGIPGEMGVDVGNIAAKIGERSHWSDLVVVHLAHPPSEQPIKRLSSGFRQLIQRCPRPVMAVPKSRSGVENLLLAFDGSPKAEEALYIGTYLASKLQLSLIVLIVLTGDSFPAEAIAHARWYLNLHKIQAGIHVRLGPIAETILKTADEFHADLILMGGYSHSPVLEIVLGSVVNKVLNQTKYPVLICR